VTVGIEVWSTNFDNIEDYDTMFCVVDTGTGYIRGGHAVTMVGYDDNKITHDGTGAFRLVNSWGTGWGNGGFFWMSYEAVKHPRLSQRWINYTVDRVGYSPTVQVRYRLNHPTRGRIDTRLGVGSSGSPDWIKDFFNWNKPMQADWSFPAHNIVLDISDGDSHLDSTTANNVFLRCIDILSDGQAGSIEYFFCEHLGWGTSSVSSETPQSIPDDRTPAYVNLSLQGSVPNISVTPDTLVFSCVNFTLKKLLGLNSASSLSYPTFNFHHIDVGFKGPGLTRRRRSIEKKMRIGLNSDVIESRLSVKNSLSKSSGRIYSFSEIYKAASGKKALSRSKSDEVYSNRLDGRSSEDTIHFDGPYNNDGIGLTAGGTYEAGTRITPTELAGYNGWLTTAIIFYHHDTTTHSCAAKVYSAGTDTTPGALITQRSYSASDSGWHRIDLTDPVALDAGQDIWASVEVKHAAGEYPIGIDAGPAIDGKGDWIYFGGTWSELQDIPLDYNWNVRVIVSAGDTVKTMLVCNTGNVSLDVDSIIASETWITNVSPTSFTIPPGDSQSVTVTVTSDALGNGIHHANLSIYSDDLYANPYIEPVKFVISSASIEPDIFVTPDTLDFSYGKGAASGPSFLESDEDMRGLAFAARSMEDVNRYSRSPDDTIYYDDGTGYFAYQGTYNALYWAVRFTPVQPCTVKAGMVMTWVYTGNAPACSLFVWDDVSGQPGSMVAGPFTFTADNAFVTVPITPEYTDADDFWVGYYLPWYSPGDTTYALTDSSSEYGSRQSISADRLSWTVNPGLSGDLMIRAIVSYEGVGIDTVETMVVHNTGTANLNVTSIAGSETWITGISPTSFTVPPGDSQNVTVTVTRDGLANGTHYAYLSIYSDDPDENPYSEPVKFIVIAGTEIIEEETAPEVFFLSQNYPNPFNHTTVIEFGLAKDSYVNISIYNLAGQRVTTLMNRPNEAGYYKINWSGMNDKGMKVSPGIYFISFITGDYKSVKKLLLIR